MDKTYIVTISPKFPQWNYKAWDVEVVANSKSHANRMVRRQLEREGHVFTHSDAATFTARAVAD